MMRTQLLGTAMVFMSTFRTACHIVQAGIFKCWTLESETAFYMFDDGKDLPSNNWLEDFDDKHLRRYEVPSRPKYPPADKFIITAAPSVPAASELPRGRTVRVSCVGRTAIAGFEL